MRRLLAALLLSASPAFGGASSFVSDAAILVDYGLFCPFDAEGRAPAPLTETGDILLIDQSRQVDITTAQIPAVLGLSFGLRLRLPPGATYDRAQIRVIHPPLGPSGVTQQIWDTAPSDGAATLDIFRFEYPHELVLGDWKMGLLLDGVLVLEQRFKVLPPEAAPDLAKACTPAALTS